MSFCRKAKERKTEEEKRETKSDYRLFVHLTLEPSSIVILNEVKNLPIETLRGVYPESFDKAQDRLRRRAQGDRRVRQSREV